MGFYQTCCFWSKHKTGRGGLGYSVTSWAGIPVYRCQRWIIPMHHWRRSVLRICGYKTTYTVIYSRALFSLVSSIMFEFVKKNVNTFFIFKHFHFFYLKSVVNCFLHVYICNRMCNDPILSLYVHKIYCKNFELRSLF